jgi:hypothetical protein
LYVIFHRRRKVTEIDQGTVDAFDLAIEDHKQFSARGRR